MPKTHTPFNQKEDCLPAEDFFAFKPLKGAELVAKIKDLMNTDLSDEEKCLLCGYRNKKGEPLMRAFQQEILNAFGIESPSPRRKVTRPIKVNKNGSILLGASRVSSAGFQPGDALQVRIGRRKIVIEDAASVNGAPKRY